MLKCYQKPNSAKHRVIPGIDVFTRFYSILERATFKDFEQETEMSLPRSHSGLVHLAVLVAGSWAALSKAPLLATSAGVTPWCLLSPKKAVRQKKGLNCESIM